MTQQAVSSGSDSDPRYANMDDRKRKRMISNRESARRSRLRKQQHLDDLTEKSNNFRAENAKLSLKIDETCKFYDKFEAENNVLRAQIMELTDRLRSLNNLLEIVEDVSGVSVDIPQVPDTLLEPWHLPCNVEAIPNGF